MTDEPSALGLSPAAAAAPADDLITATSDELRRAERAALTAALIARDRDRMPWRSIAETTGDSHATLRRRVLAHRLVLAHHGHYIDADGVHTAPGDTEEDRIRLALAVARYMGTTTQAGTVRITLDPPADQIRATWTRDGEEVTEIITLDKA